MPATANVLRQQSSQLARLDREAMRAALVEDLMPATIDGLREALTPKQKCGACGQYGEGAKRWAVRNVLEMAKLVGAETQVAVFLSQRFGVKSEQELEHIVQRGKSLAELDDAPTETHWQEAMTLLSLCLKEQPSLIPSTRQWLDGLNTATVTESPESAEAAPGTPVGPDLDPEDA